MTFQPSTRVDVDERCELTDNVSDSLLLGDISPRTYLVQTATAEIPAARVPTLYFIGVTTKKSSIRRVFPRWARELELGRADLVGIDLPLHADRDAYRSVVNFVASDPLSLGALVTTHKIDLFEACKDLFDVIDPHASLMQETSCLSKRGGQLVCHAKDPISSGLALDAILPPGHFTTTGADVVSMGAGGSTIAISWHLTQPERGADRPRRFVTTNRSEPRLRHIASVHERMTVDSRFDYVFAPDPRDNDAVLRDLPPGSLVINATGLGKDAPGSPLTHAANFPRDGIAWDLNYRGDLVFLDQARAQADERLLTVHDGWVYFLHGWMQVIAEVFDVSIPTTGPGIDRLSALARSAR